MMIKIERRVIEAVELTMPFYRMGIDENDCTRYEKVYLNCATLECLAVEVGQGFVVVSRLSPFDFSTDAGMNEDWRLGYGWHALTGPEFDKAFADAMEVLK